MSRRFAQKISAPKSDDITCWKLFDRDPTWDSSQFVIAAIDIGVKNFAVTIETRTSQRITTDYLDVVDVKRDTYEASVILLSSYLHSILPHLMRCHAIVVERQLPDNYLAVRTSQHVISWLSIYLLSSPCCPIIVELEARLKYSRLDCPKNFVKNHIKKVWAPERACQLLRARGSLAEEQRIMGARKKDDLSDVVVMAEAMCRIWGLIVTPE
jgi:hypothetical protein